MQTEIKKWGNSAVVRLPATMLAELQLAVGSPIELKHENGQLIIEPVRPIRQGWFDSPPAKDDEALGAIPVDEGDEDWQW
jgi:antitoxin MazE